MITDSRKIKADCLFVCLKGDSFDAHDFIPQAIQQGAKGTFVLLANEALAVRDLGEASGNSQRYVTLARFFAENITVQATSLEKTVMDGADAVTDADAVLLGRTL